MGAHGGPKVPRVPHGVKKAPMAVSMGSIMFFLHANLLLISPFWRVFGHSNDVCTLEKRRTLEMPF